MSGIGPIPGCGAATLGELYQTHAHRVYNFMRYRAGNTEAQDLTQMVFEKALAGFERYSPQKGSMEVWLFTIARNVLYDHYRKAGRVQVLELEESGQHEAPDKTPVQALACAEENAALGRALRRLKKKELTCISLKYAGGLKNTEIAQVMSFSVQNTGVILHRAIKKLRTLMEKELEQ